MHIRAGLANAQGFVNPLIGYDFGGDTTCPNVDDCEEKKLNAGVSIGKMGRVLGIEGAARIRERLRWGCPCSLARA